ncbi:MAG: lytic transglycosylase domain-containing protein [Comamonadaceae bacterium]|nr:MAG: lytic transglycosylase domain-containing protein [Comamonadaceae bacterium]
MWRSEFLKWPAVTVMSLLWAYAAGAAPTFGRGDAMARSNDPSIQRVGNAVVLEMAGGRRDVTPGAVKAKSGGGALHDTANVNAAALAARSAGVDPHLVRAVAWAESGFRADAVSPKGAMGVMQLMPATALQYGVDDPFNATKSLEGGSRLLRDLLLRYEGDVPLALAAYNAGPGAVERAGRNVPNYPETRAYVGRVMGAWTHLRGAAPAENAPAADANGPTADRSLGAPAQVAPPGARAVGNAWVVDVSDPARRPRGMAPTGFSL